MNEYTESNLRNLIDQYSFQNHLDRYMDNAPILSHGSASIVSDVNGKAYIDFNAGQMCAALGHNHPRIQSAIFDACETMIHSSSTFYNVPEILLSAKIGELSPEPLKKSFFLSSGSDSNEAAITMAKAYTGGYEIASPHISFHGLSETPRAVTHAGWRNNVGPFAPGAHAMFAPYCYRCPLQKTYPECQLECVDASFVLLDAESTGHQAAVITEPLFSAGGVVEPPAGWLKKVQDKCHERDMLLIVDEAQTGLAKLGSMYAFTQEDGVSPDIVTLSKHLGGGVDISAVVSTPEIEERLVNSGFVYSHSHTSDPLGCRAAIASLEIIEEDGLNQTALELGAYWRGLMDKLQQEFEVIGDVRGRGLIQGIELVKDRESREPYYEAGSKLTQHCLKNGLIFSVRNRGCVIRFVPPFTTTFEQMDEAAEILKAGLATL